MTDLLAAEWLKLRSLRSTWWTPALTGLAVVTSALLSAQGHDEHTAFPLAGYLILMIVAVASGAGMISAEYATGLIRATTVAVPARGELLVAKAVVLAAVWTVAGSVFTVASFLASAGFASAGAFAGAILVAPVCAVIGLGLGVLIRHGAAAAVTGIILLALVPQLLSTRRPLTVAVNHAMVLPAWQRLTHSYGPPGHVGHLYPGLPAAVVVYVVWPVAIMAAALVTIRRRDV
ncbi:hypothetical protein ACQP2F_20450 [Actinoplanes sp. CA-030573]|uniref:hypothetical protein n=1 Tax=Actinoplanes sp. CA-030573 TaxID=3239898 RepID=UPI003D8A572E